MQYDDCAVTLREAETAHVLCPEVDLLSLEDASEEPQDGVPPMIKGLDKATRPNTRRVTSCPEVCSQLAISGLCTHGQGSGRIVGNFIPPFRAK